MITYRKTKSGEWVAYGPANEMHVGQITVIKKSGQTKAEYIDRLGKAFTVDGTQMVYGYLGQYRDNPVRRAWAANGGGQWEG